MKKNKLRSPAKLNLTLEVIKKLPDGFHLIRSIMVKTYGLYDEVEMIFERNKKGIKIICSDKKIPCDAGNIAWKMADRFFERTGRSVSVIINIKKKIPAGAGLGGGSSNGAAVLLALNEYFDKPLSQRQMIEVAASVGKDIPFFLSNDQAAYVSGAGEKFSGIKDFPKLNYLIIFPLKEISTAWAYGELDKKIFYMDSSKRKNISKQLMANIRDGSYDLFHNDFEPVALSVCPEISMLKNSLISFGARGVSITGKGPTVFGILSSLKKAKEVQTIIKKEYPSFLTFLG
jgi:4-diphosphocytidyl-2-C-methyl-D-erythritol kinase